MSTMLRFTLALAFVAFAVPASAVGHGNEGTDETTWSGPYTHRSIGSAVQDLAPGHGNEGGDLDTSQSGDVTRIEFKSIKAYEPVVMGTPAEGNELARFVDRSQDAGG